MKIKYVIMTILGLCFVLVLTVKSINFSDLTNDNTEYIMTNSTVIVPEYLKSIDIERLNKKSTEIEIQHREINDRIMRLEDVRKKRR